MASAKVADARRASRRIDAVQYFGASSVVISRLILSRAQEGAEERVIGFPSPDREVTGFSWLSRHIDSVAIPKWILSRGPH